MAGSRGRTYKQPWKLWRHTPRASDLFLVWVKPCNRFKRIYRRQLSSAAPASGISRDSRRHFRRDVYRADVSGRGGRSRGAVEREYPAGRRVSILCRHR
jgi:hypothetical protein